MTGGLGGVIILDRQSLKTVAIKSDGSFDVEHETKIVGKDGAIIGVVSVGMTKYAGLIKKYDENDAAVEPGAEQTVLPGATLPKEGQALLTGVTLSGATGAIDFTDFTLRMDGKDFGTKVLNFTIKEKGMPAKPIALKNGGVLWDHVEDYHFLPSSASNKKELGVVHTVEVYTCKKVQPPQGVGLNDFALVFK